MNRKQLVQRQPGDREAGLPGKASFADSIAGADNPMRRSSGRSLQSAQMGDDKPGKQRGRAGDFR